MPRSASASSRASSGPTPRGSPPAASFCAMTIFPKLTPARSVPLGANSERSEGETVGVMAQEVQTVVPEAVVWGRDGYLRVFYDKLGLEFQTYDRWVAAGARLPAVRH